MQTEFEFSLPRGYVDENGQVHRTGRMRLATAADEISSAQDQRVVESEAFLPVVLLSRVVVSLGTLPAVTPRVIADLFAADLAYLEDIYERLNAVEPEYVQTICPHCSQQFTLQITPPR